MGGSSWGGVLREACRYRQWLCIVLCVTILPPCAYGEANTTISTVNQTLSPTPAPVNSLITTPVLPREKVALPTFSPIDTSPYVLSVTINITCATEGAIVRYTTDGSSPLDSPTAVAVPAAENGGSVVWEKLGRTVFRASASKAGYNDSDVAEASYVVLGRAALPVFGRTTHDNVYIGFANLTITSETPGAVIEYTTDGSSTPSSASHSLPSGATLLWDRPGTSVIRAHAVKGDYAPSAIVELTLTVIQQVAAPQFEPSGRSSFVSAVTLTVRCATPQSLVWYTWDGSMPMPGKAHMARPGDHITYNHTGAVLLSALATRDGLLDSRLSTRHFDVMGKVATPIFLLFTPPFHRPDTEHAVVVRNASFTIVSDTPGANISFIAADATPVVPDYEDGDFDAYASLSSSSSKPKKPPEPTWLPLTYKGERRKNLSCGVMGFTHYRAVARKHGMADSDVAHLYLHVIRELVVEYPMHHVDDHFTLLAQVLQEGIGNGTRNSTTLVDVGEEQASADDSMMMDNTPPPSTQAEGQGQAQGNGQGGGQGQGHTEASALAPDVRADDDAMPETKSPTRRPTLSTREWDAEVGARHYDDDSWSRDPPPTPIPPTPTTRADKGKEEGNESGPPSPVAAAAGVPLGGLDLGGTRRRDETGHDSKVKVKKDKEKKTTTTKGTQQKEGAPTATSPAPSHHSPTPSPLHPLNTSMNGSLALLNGTSQGDGDTWRPVSGSPNSSTLSTAPGGAHRTFRRPLSVHGYEGVQPLLSMHVLQAQFRDCSWCTPRRVKGRVVTLDNPARHFSLLPQRQGCGHGPELPSVSGRAFSLPPRPIHYLPPGFNESLLQRLNDLTDRQYAHVKDLGCQVVTNGGFFNTTSYDCFGNLVSQGRVMRTSDRRVTSFGLRNGSFVVGYLTPAQIQDTANPFQELISGLGWLVREGQSYVEESLRLEDLSFQETGTQFATVKSARTALGHDRRGRLVLVQMEGETWSSGVDLYELADLLVELGVVNAINLDGGGSATLTQNHSLVSDPSWLCDKHNPKSLFRCEKPVASITCIHAAPPPIFRPLEATWANYTNITTARLEAQRIAEEQAALSARSQLCAGFCPHPHVNLSLGNATAIKVAPQGGGGWWAGDEKARYKAWSVVLGVCLVLSLGLHVHTCWARRTSTVSHNKHTRRESQHALLGPGLLNNLTPYIYRHNSGPPGGPSDGPSTSSATSSATSTSGGVGRRTSWGLRDSLGGRVGRGSSSHGSSGFERVRLDDEEEGEEEVEIEIDSFQPSAVAEGAGVGAERRPSLVEAIGGWLNLKRLSRPKGRRGSREAEGEGSGVREMELELNPFLAGAFPAGTREAAMM